MNFVLKLVAAGLSLAYLPNRLFYANMEMCWCDDTPQGVHLGQNQFNPVVGEPEPYCTSLPSEENQQHGPVKQLSLPEENAPPWYLSGPWPGYHNDVLPVPVRSEPATEVEGQHCSFGGYGYGASSAAAGLQPGMVGETMRYDLNYIRTAGESESIRPVQTRHQTPDIRRDLTQVSRLDQSFNFGFKF